MKKAKKISNENKNRIILISIVLLCVLVYFFVPQINSEINYAFNVLRKLDINEIASYIRSFGSLAVIISFLLMVLQAIIAPIPAFFITLANSMIWGWWKGAILSWSSAMAGALLCFFIARILGRDVVKKIATNGALQSAEEFFDRFGKQAILICRLLPFVPFDPVSYAAGLTSMNFWSFFIATGIGQLPATIIYSYFGGQLTGGAQALMYGLLGLFAFSLIVYVGKKIYQEKQKSKKIEK
ncbi:TVP38/TMEM64 family protein [Anaerococcus vaginalis]|uniref:TVP38/TMEM64 family membrane protein n=2 Tax=Anaerococcus vaginalis TaxID=33037 RepID=C7HTS3_9FIRM|nr:TVP38/TMEM64 family protein [Anaerococcus vaginalis]EEU12863.1 SNARE-like domain protein [Anaerococcus vaginalis ATCC 51170]MDU2649471.1 TVP38/TMEM64 family protein [Anaerococcus vaginalis]MDU5559964.1 TVP38/TMEM64 family protein [Anaerococcus vaginalis]QQB62708.1 TVP38/TMEM64 family protein [Anaerococcus vaginalis]